MSKFSCYPKACVLQTLVWILQVISIEAFMLSFCTGGMTKAMLLVETLRWFAAMCALLGVSWHQNEHPLQFIPLFSSMILLGLYVHQQYPLLVLLGECYGSAAVYMIGYAFHFGCCLLCAFALVADKPQSPVAPLRLKDDPDKRLAHLTLKTFTVETQCSETDQIGECVICLNGPYCPEEVVTELHCHHTFHYSCIAGWVYNRGRGCPMRCEACPISANEVDLEAAVPPRAWYLVRE